MENRKVKFMAQTKRAKHQFRVTAYGDGTPWIVFDLLEGKDLSILGKGFLGFDLKPGTTHKQAEELADKMNKLITDTSYTG